MWKIIESLEAGFRLWQPEEPGTELRGSGCCLLWLLYLFPCGLELPMCWEGGLFAALPVGMPRCFQPLGWWSLFTWATKSPKVALRVSFVVTPLAIVSSWCLLFDVYMLLPWKFCVLLQYWTLLISLCVIIFFSSVLYQRLDNLEIYPWWSLQQLPRNLHSFSLHPVCLVLFLKDLYQSTIVGGRFNVWVIVFFLGWTLTLTFLEISTLCLWDLQLSYLKYLNVYLSRLDML